MSSCCSKEICIGCDYANQKREIEARLQGTCPFCRKATPKTDKEITKLQKKRVEANDLAAICYKGVEHYRKGHYSRAVAFFTKAAELGFVDAHFKLALLYHDGEGVAKDEGKAVHHLEEAAIAGHPIARYNLGVHENCNGNAVRAVKHYIIAATQGDDGAIKQLMKAFKEGHVSKEELAVALRAQKAAVDATKSRQRVEAEEFYRYRKNNIR